jgi:chromosome segregation ATPase
LSEEKHLINLYKYQLSRLRNEGVDAFEVERYGRSITVVRTLQLSKKSAQSLDGDDVGKADALQATSTYQLRGESNRAVSKKAADLDRLLLHFGIDIENPLTILQQETAKQFLANTTAQRRYEFFKKGTLLHYMKEKYLQVYEHVKVVSKVSKKLSEKLSTLRDQMVEWDLQFKALQELEHAEETLTKLRLHLAWSRYLHAERDRERQSKKLERIDIENNELDKKIEKLRKEYANRQRERTLASKKVSNLQELLAQQRQGISKHRFTMNNASVLLNQLKNQFGSREADRASSARELDALEKRIAQILNTQQMAEKRRARENQEQEISALSSEVQQLTIKMTADKQEENACHSSLSQIRMDITTIENGKVRLESQLQEVCAQITHMSQRPEGSSANQGSKLQERLRLFFPSHWQLNKLIEQNASQFKHKPIGPLAAYVSVKDKRWLVPVQFALGNLCFAYWVDNHNDLMRLQPLIDRTFTNKAFHPSVIIQPRSVR